MNARVVVWRFTGSALGTIAIASAAHCASLGICDIPVWTHDGDQADGRFGTVAPAGDVNGDGYADVLIGAYNYDHGQADEGVVYLFLGGPTGLATSPAWTAESNQVGARLGDKLSGAGDVNGDGYDDVIIGAAFFDSTHVDAGAAFLYAGSPSGLSTEPVWIAVGDQDGAQFGACVQAAGDVNGDGYADVIVGSWLYDHGEVDEGRAYVYCGSDSGLADMPAWIGESQSPGAVYGYFCASAGDVNGDGFDDIVVGARRFSGNGLAEEGRVYVYHGSSSGPSLEADWIRDAGKAKSEFGAYTISAGDVDADGYDDLLVGAFRYENPELDEGMACLFLGSANGLSMTAAWEVEGGIARNNFGYHLDGAGDVNGDGYDDVIVSAPGVDTYGFAYHNAGQVFVYQGHAGGLSTIPAWTQQGDQDNMSLEAVRGVGDVNGDGFDDVATGALYRDNGEVDAGRAWVFYGCADGRTDVPRIATSGSGVQLAGANPFTTSTAFVINVPVPQAARLCIRDLLGRHLVTLFRGRAEPGGFVVRWNGQSDQGGPVPPGLYFATLETDRVSSGAKVVKLR
jgi:FG-GAP repeat